MAAPTRVSVHATKVVPWFDRNEFLSVYNDLFSDDLRVRRYGVDKVAVWKSRVHQDLSIAIESSTALISVLCDHEEAQKAGTTQENDDRLRSTYSMALIRFVNHVTQRGQTKQSAIPIHELAKQCGIPLWIVRLRHDATHRSLPSLDILYSGAILALEWLHSDFWVMHLSETGTNKPPKELKDDSRASRFSLQDSIQKYAELRCKELETSNDGRLHQQYKQVIVELQTVFTLIDPHELLSCLVNDGYVFSNRYFDHMDINEEDILHSESDVLMPEKILNLWKPLLCILKTVNLLPLLCQQMISATTDVNNIKNHLIMGWLIAICHGTLGNNKSRGNVNLPWETLLQLCLYNPNQFTNRVTEVIMSKMRSQEYQKKIVMVKSLLALYQSDSPITTGCSNDTIYSVDDILTTEQSQTKVPSLDDKDSSLDRPNSGSIWHLSHIETDWSSFPFGLLPGKPVKYSDLELGDDRIVNGQIGLDGSMGNVCRETDLNMMDTSEMEKDCQAPSPFKFTEKLKQAVTLF